MHCTDLLIVGAGPAGMAAGIEARRRGLEVLVIDEQAAPGGQIWRSVELTKVRDEILGPSYVEGRAVAEAFRAAGVVYWPGAKLWQIDPDFRASVSLDQHTRIVQAKAAILATGALERPVPFPGWTLPGVLTVGAAQILLKTAGQIPNGPVWIAGSGPLPLLYLVQLLRAGGQVAGYLDTTPRGQWLRALRHLPRALLGLGDLIKGLGWLVTLRLSRMRVIKGVTKIEALGVGAIESLRYETGDGNTAMVEARTLLVHEGVIPHLHPALSLDCAVEWRSDQESFAPIVDIWGESSRENLFIAGDGAGIAGATAAGFRGALAGLGAAAKLGRMSSDEATAAALPIRRKLNRAIAARPFLDALFKPRSQVFAPSDETIVCRCEEITAGVIRGMVTAGNIGPNQVKAATRAGMGPCQGRQCGYTVTHLLAAIQNRKPSEIGFFHIRPPLKPVTLGELAAIDASTSG